ncbi:uncharacterized protein LAESUDRAFT_648791 [Laetiporus sulphureus 93-53]|uniref:Exosome complex protein n=1 Tax=Laetiporus sulphureus 93-53 TaxID=1314785 RepID=A0A165F7Z5_9APHY|nr:uncharacterized protein LAESUDRAFT_648791 [Laetiporus sulphureus 93-53]KZT08565.1 hypothetical protein LAESUDRAFT_648791 [Laetiporus sulphureus 93-53]
MDSDQLHTKVTLLNDALDDLEAKLEPLLAQSLPETVVGLERIQQAKLQVALPYLVYDLIFIYLKTKGVEPKTHPVVEELARIRQYFDKIKDAENPAKRTTEVDKAAANRFIKHAIAQVKAQRPPGDNEGPSHIRFDDSGIASVPVKVTSKMIARAQYEKELAEMGSEEEDDLQIIDDAEGATNEIAEVTPPSIGKGKARAVDETESTTSAPGRKRRRPQVDPFAGYGDAPNGATQSEDTSKRSKTSRDQSTSDVEMANTTPQDSGRSTPLSASEQAKKERKAAKRARQRVKKRPSKT